MKNQSRSLAILATMLSAASGPWGGLAKIFRFASPSGRIRYSQAYPEQPRRQALRGSRRAQGGPGLEFVDGSWQARAR